MNDTPHAPAVSMKEISHCVICEKRLDPERVHVDTCGEKCFRKLLEIQRASV
jgi:predicted nucleic acid-binding Zn ribbon protein